MKKVAVIGSGISGLVSAYLISQKHQVTLFEKDQRLGGHTATIDVEVEGKPYAIDTGFIVFNDKTYPNFLKLLAQIGIDKQPTEMSFSVQNKMTGLEYNGHNLNTLFSQRRNLFNPKFWHLIRQIVRFNKMAKQHYQQYMVNADDAVKFAGDNRTLGDFLDQHGFTDYFSEHYILPMTAAIWSTSLSQARAFPLTFFIQFFYHHGLLNITDRPQWYVIPGGSRSYIDKLTTGFKDNIELNAHIDKVQRIDDGISILFEDGSERVFDEVVFACHSDQALALLAEPNELEQEVLGQLPYSPNEVVLHLDEAMLPTKRLSWASWNYQLTDNAEQPAAVTYDMNILMGLKAKHTFCVTLNQTEQIDPSKILAKFVYHHPVISPSSYQAQQRRGEICGVNRVHFAGAYWYQGFHEDGVVSALDVAARFGVEL